MQFPGPFCGEVLRQQTPSWREGNGPGGAGPRGALMWEEEEGLFKAKAVNEKDPERDRATQV